MNDIYEKINSCFQGKNRFSCFGYGNTIKAIACKFKNCDIYDDNFTEIKKDEYQNMLYPSDFFDPEKSFLEITSPGIPPYNNLILKAKNLISEYDFFAHIMPFSIWITGTNGKTTTTQMLHFLMEKYNSDIGGNIGIPLANMDEKKKYWILETSSFTLHYTKIAKPNIFILLPITFDHISWHGSFEAYKMAKLSILKKLDKNDIAIIPEEYRFFSTQANVYYYDKNNLNKFLGIDQNKIRFKGCFLLDSILALSVTKILFDEIDYEKINNFEIDKHRQQEFYDKYKRLWINDSKSTTVDSTIQLISIYKDKKIHLILGGDFKGALLDDFFEYLKNLDITIYCIGQSTDYLIDMCKKYNVKHFDSKTLDVAVFDINKFHDKNSVAMLSPAAASTDQFKSYKERGDLFMKLVYEL